MLHTPSYIGANVEFENSPGLIRSYWIRLLCILGYMARVTVKGPADDQGHSVLITYRVFSACWMNDPCIRRLRGFPVVARKTDGDTLMQAQSWDLHTGDVIEYDTRTRVGRVEFDSGNRSY
jgi:hypothetical protein